MVGMCYFVKHITFWITVLGCKSRGQSSNPNVKFTFPFLSPQLPLMLLILVVRDSLSSCIPEGEVTAVVHFCVCQFSLVEKLTDYVELRRMRKDLRKRSRKQRS